MEGKPLIFILITKPSMQVGGFAIIIANYAYNKIIKFKSIVYKKYTKSINYLYFYTTYTYKCRNVRGNENTNITSFFSLYSTNTTAFIYQFGKHIELF